jgi:hypothetical protein
MVSEWGDLGFPVVYRPVKSVFEGVETVAEEVQACLCFQQDFGSAYLS